MKAATSARKHSASLAKDELAWSLSYDVAVDEHIAAPCCRSCGSDTLEFMLPTKRRPASVDFQFLHPAFRDLSAGCGLRVSLSATGHFRGLRVLALPIGY